MASIRRIIYCALWRVIELFVCGCLIIGNAYNGVNPLWIYCHCNNNKDNNVTVIRRLMSRLSAVEASVVVDHLCVQVNAQPLTLKYDESVADEFMTTILTACSGTL